MCAGEKTKAVTNGNNNKTAVTAATTTAATATTTINLPSTTTTNQPTINKQKLPYQKVMLKELDEDEGVFC